MPRAGPLPSTPSVQQVPLRPVPHPALGAQSRPSGPLFSTELVALRFLPLLLPGCGCFSQILPGATPFLHGEGHRLSRAQKLNRTGLARGRARSQEPVLGVGVVCVRSWDRAHYEWGQSGTGQGLGRIPRVPSALCAVGHMFVNNSHQALATCQ